MKKYWCYYTLGHEQRPHLGLRAMAYSSLKAKLVEKQ